MKLRCNLLGAGVVQFPEGTIAPRPAHLCIKWVSPPRSKVDGGVKLTTHFC